MLSTTTVRTFFNYNLLQRLNVLIFEEAQVLRVVLNHHTVKWIHDIDSRQTFPSTNRNIDESNTYVLEVQPNIHLYARLTI